MCIEHASTIDDPTQAEHFSPKLLHQMKIEQIEFYDQLQQGWIQTDSMAEHAAQSSFSNVGLVTGARSTIQLGGKGGAAPGAGGGGGGAIGNNARGGSGGRGGKIIIDDGEYTIPPEIDSSRNHDFAHLDLEQHPDLEPIYPGSGGGGGPALGDDAVGGSGGDGGDFVTGIYDIEALRADGFSGECRIIVGAGGRPQLPNQIPEPGEDTIIQFLKDDGSVMREVRAKAGGHGMAFLDLLPEGWNSISPELSLRSKLRVTSLMAANNLEINNENYYLFGGDWSFLSVLDIPSDYIIQTLLTVRFDDLPDERDYVVFLSAYNPAGDEKSRYPAIISKQRYPFGVAKFIVPLGVHIDLSGRWKLRAWSNEFELMSVDITVKNLSEIDVE